MRTIKNLINKEKKVYIFLKDEETREKFSKNAQAEGITFSDGSSLKGRTMQDIMALLSDGTICYLGFAGRMCYKNGGDTAIRIDYKRYCENCENYIIDPKKI